MMKAILLTLLTLVFFSLHPLVAADVPVSFTVDPHAAIGPIPADFAGLSIEAAVLPPDASGENYFSPDNASLVNLFKTIGVKNLRVGGTTVDGRFPRKGMNYPNQPTSPEVTPPPTASDVDHLFQFARAAQSQVIFSFRIFQATPDYIQNSAVPLAQQIMAKYPEVLDCFCIGNEPSSNNIAPTYEQFMKLWRPVYSAIVAAEPTAKFCGPSEQPSKESVAKRFSADVVQDPAFFKNVAFIDQHVYLAPASIFKNPQGAIGNFMGNKAPFYQTLVNRLLTSQTPPVVLNNLPYRITETNSYSGGGYAGASNSYGSALWGLDYAYWWAAHQARGINFHTGYHGPSLDRPPAAYSAFTSTGNGAHSTQTAQGLAYALLAFKLGSSGTLLSGQADFPKTSGLALSAYAVASGTSTFYVTIINKSSGPGASTAAVTVHFPDDYLPASAQACYLTQESHDVAQLSGIGMGDSLSQPNPSIQPDGTWKENWATLPLNSGSNHLATVSVPPATAAVVKFSSEMKN